MADRRLYEHEYFCDTSRVSRESIRQGWVWAIREGRGGGGGASFVRFPVINMRRMMPPCAYPRYPAKPSDRSIWDASPHRYRLPQGVREFPFTSPLPRSFPSSFRSYSKCKPGFKRGQLDEKSRGTRRLKIIAKEKIITSATEKNDPTRGRIFLPFFPPVRFFFFRKTDAEIRNFGEFKF